MPQQKASSNLMLDTYLFSNNGVVDRLVQSHGYHLRSNDGVKHPDAHHSNTSSNKGQDKRAVAAVNKLEEKMDMLTDPNLLNDARAYQRGK